MPVHLGPLDRSRVGTTFDQMAQSFAGYEASAEVTAFTSKFDAVLAGKRRDRNPPPRPMNSHGGDTGSLSLEFIADLAKQRQEAPISR